MRSTRLVAIAFMLILLITPSAKAQTVLTPISIEPHLNFRIQTLLGEAPNFPDGPQVFNGIPFSRPASGLNAWNALFEVGGSMEGLRTIDINVGLFGATEVYTLINTMTGEQKPGTFATLEFHGSAGALHQHHLDGNSDIRDYLQGDFTNTINGTSTVKVFSAGSGRFSVRLDMQTIELPSEFSNQVLDFIRVIDNGGANFGVLEQRLILSGVTVAAVPEPNCLWLAATCIAAFNRKLRS